MPRAWQGVRFAAAAFSVGDVFTRLFASALQNSSMSLIRALTTSLAEGATADGETAPNARMVAMPSSISPGIAPTPGSLTPSQARRAGDQKLDSWGGVGIHVILTDTPPPCS